MAQLPKVQTEATLLRFSVNPNQFLDEYAIWTLELPAVFQEALWQFKTGVQDRLKSRGKRETISLPTRQLNNALMAIFPTLVHGFEIKKMEAAKTTCHSRVGSVMGGASVFN
jgi:hypothetical protein